MFAANARILKLSLQVCRLIFFCRPGHLLVIRGPVREKDICAYPCKRTAYGGTDTSLAAGTGNDSKATRWLLKRHSHFLSGFL